MKKSVLLMILLGCCLWLPQAAAEPIRLQVTDADVRTVLGSIARLGNLSIVLDDSVQGNISLQLSDIEPRHALQAVAAAKGLSVEELEHTLVIKAKSKNMDDFCRMYIFPIRFLDLDTAVSAVNLSLGEAGIASGMKNINSDVDAKATQKAVSYAGRTMADPSTNALLFYGTEEEAASARQTLAELDVPVKQVSLEAKVIAIQKDASKNLGVDWEWSKLPRYPEQTVSYKSVQKTVPDGTGRLQTVTEDIPEAKTERSWHKGESMPGILQFGKGPEGHPFEFYYEVTLNALIAEGKAKILARPNITTLQGREAVINIGGEVPVPTVSTTNSTTTTSVLYRPAGIILRYTPRVNGDGYITAAVHTEVSSPVYVEALKAYKFQKRSADTAVRLKDGQTMVIGGLIGSEESRSLSKVPFLGDLPVLGAFFRSVRNSRSESEIMIFLTAHILDKS